MLEPGMAAMIYPEGTDSRSGRYLLAEIVKIDIYEEAALPASGLPDSRRGAAVVCALPSGTILPEGTSVTVRFLLGDASPAEKLFPGLNARWRD